MKIKATGPQIGVNGIDPVFYLLEIKVAVECTNIGGQGDQDGLWVQEWEFTQVLDGDTGKFYEMHLISTVDPADL